MNLSQLIQSLNQKELTILIHEDGEITMMFYKTVFKQLKKGIVYYARDVYTALEYLNTKRIDVLVTDYAFPVMTFDVFYTKIPNKKNLKIIIITGATSQEVNELRDQYKESLVFKKPISIAELFQSKFNT